MARNPRPAGRLTALLAAAARRQTYLNLLYLLMSLPLGLCYFAVLVVGITLSLGTLIIWVGIPLLFLLMALWWRLAAFERALAMRWLGIEIPPLSLQDARPRSRWAACTAQLGNPVTWKCLGYLLLKLPFGLLAFCLVFPLSVLTLCLLPTLTVLGLGVGFITVQVVNGLAWAWARCARHLLGMSDTAIELVEARALAERQRVRAEQADRRRRELIINASHELRTPIASIRGHIESLLMAGEREEGDPGPTEQRAYLAIVERETERLAALVEDLLALARAEAGELGLRLTPVVAAEVLEEVYQALEPLAARERQVRLIRDVPPALPPVLADRQRLGQVLLNLGRNAITYTPAGGIVCLGIEQPDAAHLAVTVADTGIGIPSEDLERVFERFYRTDASRARATGGFGLGLAIVRDLVTAMGGTVTVESKVGEGSRFRVLLPIVSR